MSTSTPQKHLGRNISRLRELRGMKQLALADAIGVSQQTISHIESSEIVDDEKLAQVARALEVSVEAIKNFSEDAVFNIISNTFTDSSSNNNNYFCTINPIEKIIELYERLLEADKDRINYLEKLLKDK